MQAVLLLLGYTNDELKIWNQCRAKVGARMIKKMMGLKPAGVRASALSAAQLVVKTVVESEVTKESSAALLLFKWLQAFCKVGVLTDAEVGILSGWYVYNKQVSMI